MLKQEKFISYSVIFEPAVEGGFNVSFPNFPGCVTFGETFEEAQKMAQEVLQLWTESIYGRNKNKKIRQENFCSPIISSIPVRV